MRTALSERRWLRFALLTSCYFAQGVPLGLLSVAVPPRLAELGFGVSDVALVSTVVTLPWAIKLIGGPFMDRFKFPSMGFRRPWVLAAQAGLTLSLIALAIVPLGADVSLVPLMVVGFLVNVFASTQDVAVDGMAIDVLEMDERGRANAFMAFGQRAGSSAFGALCGYLLSQWGLASGAVACAAMLAVVFLFAAVVRERPGERLLPWSEGHATERVETAKRGFKAIFSDLMRVLFLPMSLLLVAVEFINRVRDGIEVAVFPVFAVEQLGYTTTEYASFTGIVGLATALIGAMLGFVIDRHGAKRFLLVALAGSAACHLVAGSVPSLWEEADQVLVLAGLIYLFTQLIFVATIALFMNLCWPRVAATQFAIYMSLANLSRSVGSGAMAVVGDHLTFAQDFLIMGALLAVAAGLLLVYNQSSHSARLAALEQPKRDASPVPHPRPSAA